MLHNLDEFIKIIANILVVCTIFTMNRQSWLSSDNKTYLCKFFINLFWCGYVIKYFYFSVGQG